MTMDSMNNYIVLSWKWGSSSPKQLSMLFIQLRKACVFVCGYVSLVTL